MSAFYRPLLFVTRLSSRRVYDFRERGRVWSPESGSSDSFLVPPFLFPGGVPVHVNVLGEGELTVRVAQESPD